MKLKRLFFIALLCIVGMSSAWAQWTDITNGDGLAFSTKTAFGNPAVQKTSVYEIWTNNASAAFDLNQTVASVPAGIYELSANAMYRASYNYGTATNCVLYANIGGETFSTPIKNYGDCTANENHLAVANAMVNHKAYGNKISYIVVETDATNATIGMKSTGALTFCNNGYWFIYNQASFTFKNVTNDYYAKLKSQAEAMISSAAEGNAKTALQSALSTYSSATVANVKGLKEAIANYLWAAGSTSNPIDMTSNIENPSFEGGQLTYWYQDFGWKQPSPAANMAQPNGWDLVYSGPKVDNSKYQSFTTQTTGAKDGSCLYVRHRWGDVQAVEDLRQSVRDLPSGKYRLTVAVKGGSSVTDANTLTLTAGSNTNKTTINNFDKSNYKDYSVIVVKAEEESTLDICYGLKQTAGNEQLYYIDDFRLEYIGSANVNYNVLKGTVKKATTINAVLNNPELATTLVNAQNIINNASAEDQKSVNALVNTINGMLPTTTLTETFDGDISSWSVVTEGTTYNGTKAYGSNEIINGATPPATDIYGNSEGKVAFSSAGWGDYSYYAKTINNLPAGKYIVYYEAYNANNTTVIGENKTGLGTDFSTKTTGFTENEWTTDAVAMTVHNTGDVTISAGMRSIANTGSGSVAKLWFDNVTLYCVSTDKVVETPALAAGNEWYFRAQNGKYINASGSVGNGDVSFKVINTDLNETLLQKHNTDNYLFFNDENGLSAGNYATYTDGTVPPAKATHGLYWLVAAQDGGYTLYNLLYKKYLVVDANGNLTKGDAPYVWMLVDEEAHSMVPGADLTGKITNNSFEEGNTNGWTVDASTDTGARENSNATYSALGCDGNYLFNTWSDGKALTQNIGTLAAGIYRLSAMLATGDNQDLEGTVKLTLNDGSTTTESAMVSRHGNKTIMHERSITFVSDGTKTYTIGAIGGDTGNGGHWWYKADNFRLTYVNTTDKLFEEFTAVKNACTPWTSGDAYATTCAGYRDYTSSTAASTLLAAINYMQENFDTYAWDNASEAHPYLMKNVIKGAELNNNTYWPGGGRSMASEAGWKGQHWSGDANRDYFEQKHENQPARSQDVTMPFAGQYTLNTAVRVLQSGAFAEISIGDDKTRTKDVKGTTGGNINIDGSEGTSNMANGGNGFGWVYNKVVFPVENDNTTKKISIFLSNRDNSHAADAGGMFLYYTGNKFDYVKNKVHYYHGAWGATNAELTETAPVLDVTKATGTFNVTDTNPNGLVYTSGATINGVTNNIVSNGICADLVLVDGNNFHAHKQFEATNASYTMSSIAVKPNNGNKFGTLMIPFAATNKPAGCKIYNLDQDMNLAAEILATSTDAIAANKPVLVTESGEYRASNVDIAATTADTYSHGHLTGTYTTMNALKDTYVLQKHDDPENPSNWEVAFFKVNDVYPTVKPFRAYINELGNNNVKAINIVFEDDVETAIESAPASQERETVIYDLSGRRVQNVQRGIYIINGKKILK